MGDTSLRNIKIRSGQEQLAVPLEPPPPHPTTGRDAVLVVLWRKITAIRRGNRRWVTDLALNIGTGGDYSHHLICLDGKRTANANDPTADPETPAA
jgi:hypothetical protein